MIRIINEGILYCNQRPGYESIHAHFPFIEQLGKEELICFYSRGSAMTSADKVVAKLRSADGGNTWNEEGVVWDPSRDDKKFCYYHGAATKLKNGKLIAVLTRFDRSNPEELMWDPETGGYPDPDIVILRSEDNGHSWSKPEIVPFPEGMIGNHAGTIIELDDKNLMLNFETWKHSGDSEAAEQKSLALVSENEGKSWDLVNQVRLWDASGRDIIGIKKEGELEQMLGFAFGMPHAKLLSNGDIMSCFWCTSASITHIRWCRLKVE